MKRIAAAVAAGLVGVAAWQGASALQAQDAPQVAPTSANAPAAAPETSTGNSAAGNSAAGKSAAAKTPNVGEPSVKAETPMADRVAVLGVLNKRNGLWRDITLKPGQAVRIGDLIVRLRACETTADWEPEKLTGAFVQADLRGRDARWRRVFSGWLYKESPSLNVVENNLYDVWPKSCAMRHPDTGPDTVSAASSEGLPRRSSAKKSAPASEDKEAPAPTPSAASNSPT